MDLFLGIQLYSFGAVCQVVVCLRQVVAAWSGEEEGLAKLEKLDLGIYRNFGG